LRVQLGIRTGRSRLSLQIVNPARQKDRRTLSPALVRERLRTHLAEIQQQHERDLTAAYGRSCRSRSTMSSHWREEPDASAFEQLSSGDATSTGGPLDDARE
jgi:hypothetical protein